jgi:hypothetical protein
VSNNCHRFELPRLQVFDWSAEEFRAHMNKLDCSDAKQTS